MADTVTIGLDFENVVDLKQVLDQTLENMFDYLCVPLAHPRNERDMTGLLDRDVPLTRSDLVLPASSWSSHVVGKISPWMNFDSHVERVQMNARLAFKQEMAWASHLSLSAVILPSPDWHCTNYAACVLSTLLNISGCTLWTEVPLVSKKTMLFLRETDSEDSAPSKRDDDSWECWNKMRTLCNYHHNLHVALEITENIPEAENVDKWVSEPIRVVILPVDIFLTNKKGYPVLSKRHQELVKKLFKYNVQVIIRGAIKHPQGPSIYQQYVTWLFRQIPQLTELERYSRPYWDYLQSPLQPLMDNLESQTYETFEKDPVKYKRYEKAIEDALLYDPFLQGKQEVVLMVLGAGRGPLVFAAMRAAKTTHQTLKLYALEKNQNAVNTLYNLRDNHPDWKDVIVIASDIRNWKGGVQADIVVSELLGSFGDNELSPECLYGAQHILKEGGISIPSSYTSYLAPLSSVKLYNEVTAFNNPKNFETAYVVKFHAAHVLSAPQPCFTFVHPSKNVNCTRYAQRGFQVNTSALLHGFAGYFEAKLYGNVDISIYPPTCTPEMFSWFPLFFPLHLPIYVPAHSEIIVHMWRLTDGKKVWYEWTVTSPDTVPLHNANGRSWWIGL